jgi:hypothetical protein
MRARCLLLVLAVVCCVNAAFAADRKAVLIKTPKPYDKVVQAIQRLGGTVTMQYKYVDGIAADVPLASMPALEKIVGAENLAKDEIISIPESNGRTGTMGTIDADMPSTVGNVAPADYTAEAVTSKVSTLHTAGFTGSGIIIAVIDSGYRPAIQHVAPSRVLQGVSFVPTEPNTSNNNSNFSHGTQVAGTAAANIAFCFGNTTRFAVAARDLGTAQNGNVTNGCPVNSIRVPMLGSAPLATIYPVKIFPFSGAGAPSSRTLQAMEHVLAMRQAYDADHSQGLNIKVLNMSLGGPTTQAGRSLNDQMVEQLLNADIVTVISAGNEGFASVTTGSPGTSMGALTVGAAATAVDEWIDRAQFNAPCSTAPVAQVLACAMTYRPDANIQMAYFSSRGPTHDGRIKPDVIANGSFVYTQGSGTATTVNFASGTSFSAPETSGIAATLRQAVPSATARQIRNALIMTANASLTPAATPIDQGHGFVDAAAAFALLQSGTVPDTLDTNFQTTRVLQANLANAGRTVYSGTAIVNFTGVTPSQTAEVAYIVPKNAGTLNVRVHDIQPGAAQNSFFGDDVFIAIQGNTVHDDNYLGAFEFLGSDKTYTFTKPDEGIWRIVPTGDWTNKSPISFGVDVWTTEESSPHYTAKAKINEGDQHVYTVTVPANTAKLDVVTTWENMMASYPINDIDVALVAPDGVTVNLDCATSKAPEHCSIANPAAGKWTVVVDGFSVIPDGTPGGREMYTVRVSADGVVLH